MAVRLYVWLRQNRNDSKSPKHAAAAGTFMHMVSVEI